MIANLKNSDAKPVDLRVQCVFVDEHGEPVDAEAQWQPLGIAGASTEVMRSTAPSLSARRYVIRVRMAR